MVKTRKKLIEVALPLDAINTASAREKSIRHGHPSTLHLWWARRPLAAARAVIFAQMVDDPSEYVDTLLGVSETRRAAERELKKRRDQWEKRKAGFATGHAGDKDPGPEPTLTDCVADIERKRLFDIIEELVKWKNTTNEEVLEKARAEIWQSWRRACADNADHPRAKELFDRNKLPAFHDPFAGGGTLPLEAQRLGLEAYASDLNPVAVLINKAMIEIPATFSGRAPVNPEARAERTLATRQWRGAQGLAEDIRYYGQWMRDEAEKRIGHLYPKIEITAAMVKERPDLKPYLGRKLTVIAWVWARTVKSPNPAFRDVDVPLASTFMLSTKPEKEAYIEPVIEKDRYRFAVKVGKPKDPGAAESGTKLARGANFRCLMSDTPIAGDYIKAEGKAGRISTRMMAIVAEGQRQRVFLSPTLEMEELAHEAKPTWKPEVTISGSTQYLGVKPYGMEQFAALFTDRQLAALTTFSNLVQQVRPQVKADAISSGLPDDIRPLASGGVGTTAYAEAVAVYLALAVDRVVDRHSSIAAWDSSPTKLQLGHTFVRQAIPMTWDFAEGNPFCQSSGTWSPSVDWVSESLLLLPSASTGAACQADAAAQNVSRGRIVSTDPPYFDNVPYADLSDFFYVWLRRSLQPVFPDLFTTVAVPKSGELVAFAYRHENKEAAGAFFMSGMTQAMRRLCELAHPSFPVTIYYAFKQTENDNEVGATSTGWEAFLDAVIRAGFAITGTWPMRTELPNRVRGLDANALASSIILVCRKHAAEAAAVTRREFVTALKAELPEALSHLQQGNIAPVDLAQAAIGPGMAVYTRYSKVLDAEGKPLTVRQALTLINQTLDEALAEQEGDFDADSRWALAWFEQIGFAEGEYGVAETLSKAKNTSVSGLAEAGILESRRSKVRLLKPEELSGTWDPRKDQRLTAWEIVHQLIRALTSGERSAAELVRKLGGRAENARELAYRLYTICERKKRAPEALAYNGLVQSWPEITRLAQENSKGEPLQAGLFEDVER